MKISFSGFPVIILCLVPFFIMYDCNSVVVDGDEVISIIEEAYFEGQRDAIEGDVRIRQTDDSCWVWTKSPWDGGTTPTFNPNIICEDKKH